MPNDLLSKTPQPTPTPECEDISTETGGGSGKKTNILVSLWGRFTPQLIFIFATTYLLFWFYYPWRPLAELDIPAWMVRFASRSAQTVRATNARVIVLGTSLLGAPIGALKRPALYEELFSKTYGQHLSTDPIVSPGAVMSDQTFIVQQLFQFNKKPELIVLTYSARDFMDNEIGDRVNITPTRRVVSFINQRQRFLPQRMTMESFNECWTNHSLFLDLLRRHWLRAISVETSTRTGHPLTLFDGARMAEKNPADSAAPPEAAGEKLDDTGEQTEEMRQKHVIVDLIIYGKRYNPYNEKRMNTQLNYLDQLLQECKNHHVPVKMIGMPLSTANMKLLDPGRYDDLDRKVRAIAAKYGVDVTDFNKEGTVKLDGDDFADSVHLARKGANKFAPLFSDCVTNSAAFKTAFPNAKTH